jgi:hypothetical protein
VVDDQRDQAEVSVLQPSRRPGHVGRSGRLEAEHELAERDAGQHSVDDVLRDAAVRAHAHVADPSAGVHDRVAALTEPDRDAVGLDRSREGLPHLPRPEPRIAELLDQRGRRRTVHPENARESVPEREVPNSLCSPFGPDLGARHPPDLFGVAAKEPRVQPAAEPCDDPVLERLLVPAWTKPGRKVRKGATKRLEQAQLTDDIPRLERIREVLTAVVDARKAGPRQEVVPEHVLPEPGDGLQLREEAVTPEVEAVALELHCLGDAADDAVGLEHGRLDPATAQYVRCGQTGRPGTEHGDSR